MAPAAVLLVLGVQVMVLPRPSIAPFVFFFAGVALASWLGGRVSGLLTVVLSAAAANYAFIERPWAFALSADALRATGLFVAASVVVALLCSAFREAVLRAERTAAAAREQASMLELSHDAILSWSPEAGIDTWNSGARELYGFSVEEARGRAPDELLNTELPKPWAEIERELRARTPWEGRLVHTTKDGRHLTVSAKLQLLVQDGVERVLETDRDVTAHEKAEQALRDDLAALERMHVLSAETLELRELAPVLQAVMDTAVSIMRAEKGTLQLVDGEALHIVAHHGHAEAFLRFFAAAEKRASVCGEASRQGERVTVPDIEESPLFAGTASLEVLRSAGVRAVQSTPLLGRSGALLGILTTQWGRPFTPDEHDLWRLDLLARQTADIIEQKRSEENLREADRQKTEFLAILSHELRNPLAPITNSLYILERTPAGGDQARRAQEVIGRQVVQLSRIVDDLLEITRVTRGRIQLRPERTDLAQLVSRALEDYRTLFEEAGVRLEYRAPPAPVVVDADQNRIAQVVGNLLHNAAKFTPQGGEVAVSVAEDTGSRQAVVRVKDRGIGLSAEMLPRLFQPFTQADTTLDRSRGGLGLGLALVRALVEQHGGTVEARSEGPGRGAEFEIRLPLSATVTTEAPRGRPIRSGGSCRVLVIEDNVDSANSLRELLEIEGHEVAVAYDGRGGVARAGEFRPDVVLCDLGLPEMDGFEVARVLKADAALREARLVALSGYALPDDLERAMAAGFERHLAKPPSLENLRDVLHGVQKGEP